MRELTYIESTETWDFVGFKTPEDLLLAVDVLEAVGIIMSKVAGEETQAAVQKQKPWKETLKPWFDLRI